MECTCIEMSSAPSSLLVFTSRKKSARKTRLPALPTVPYWTLLLPAVRMSSQYAAISGLVCAFVGRQSFVGSLLPDVLPPSSSQPFVEMATVV